MLLIGASHGAMADSFQSGNSLLTKCESEAPFDVGICIGYLMSVGDTYTTAAAWEGFEPYICMPDTVTAGQLQKIWIKYANEYPEELHFSASSLVLLAYRQAFPCD